MKHKPYKVKLGELVKVDRVNKERTEVDLYFNTSGMGGGLVVRWRKTGDHEIAVVSRTPPVGVHMTYEAMHPADVLWNYGRRRAFAILCPGESLPEDENGQMLLGI